MKIKGTHFFWVLNFSGFLILFGSKKSIAIDQIPYNTRLSPFSAIGTTVRGDIRTVGMSGATVGLGDTFIASLDNPAGLAMGLNGADSNFATNIIYDRNIQNFDNSLSTYELGVAFNQYPWGFSFGYISPYREGQTYSLMNSPDMPKTLSVSTREFHFSVAHLFFKNRLSVGLSLILGQSVQEILSVTNSQEVNAQSYSLGSTIGVSYQLPHRILFGLSYRLPMSYPGGGFSQNTPELPNFLQPLETPGRLGIGVGWIPNRFFRTDFTGFILGSTPRTTLLRDEATSIGENITFQPRLGAAYDFLDFKELKGTLFGGTYYETSRAEKTSDRFHQTVGMEIKPWIFNLGWGLDIASGYRNYIVSLGINPFKIMSKIDLIPTPWHPRYAKAFPPPFYQSDQGLSRPLVKHWVAHDPDLNPIQIGLNIPHNIEKKSEKISQAISDILSPPKKKRKLAHPKKLE